MAILIGALSSAVLSHETLMVCLSVVLKPPFALAALHRLHCFVSCQNGMGEKGIVDECRRVAVSPLRVLRRRSCVFHDCNLEPLLEQFPQMRFDAHVGQHATEDDLADSPFTQLQHQIIRFRPPDTMRRSNDRLTVFDVWLVALQPVCAGPSETIEIQSSLASKQVRVRLVSFERPIELPSLVRWKEVVRRNEHLKSARLSSLEDALDVFDGIDFLETFVEQWPSETFLAQDIVLRIDNHNRGV